MPASEPSAELSRAALIARVWRDYLSSQKTRLGVAVACAVAVSATTSLLVGGLNPAVNLLLHIPMKDAARLPSWLREHPLTVIPLIFVFVALLRFVAQRGLTLSLNAVGNILVGRIQSQLFSRLVHADLGRLQNAHSGEYLSSVLYDADLVREAASSSAVSYLQNLLIVIGAFIAMFQADWIMALSVLVIGPALSLVMGRYLRLTRYAAKAAMAETSSLSTAIMESLDGIRIVKIANQESFEEQRVGAVIERRQAHIIKGSNARTMAAPATELLTGLLLAGLLAYVGWRSLHGGMTAGALLAFLTALGVAGQALRQLAGLQGAFSQGMTAARRLFAALDIRPEIVSAPDAADLPAQIGPIRFADVRFAYGEAPVLDGVSFTVDPGQSVALVGPSGSGKSTLLNLIPRFFDLTSGDIRFGEVSTRAVSLASLRSRIALVTQDPFLFDDTIRANIAYGNGTPTQDQIEQAAKDAAAHDFIMALPQGYDTRAGEAGSRLSGGQKQRIAIARAFLKNAPILLLDEATSALDAESEARVQEALERLMRGRTTFVVAHRLSTVRHADQILVLDHGKIAERGTHDDLIRQGGLYARLAAAQFDLPAETEAAR
jgi:subfamily B ATP-binding cassette protein MsbA